MDDNELAKTKKNKIQEIKKTGCEELLNTIFTDELKKTYTLEQATNDKGKLIQAALVEYKTQNNDWVYLTVKYLTKTENVLELKKIANFTKENELEESVKLFEKLKFKVEVLKNGYEHDFVKVEGGTMNLGSNSAYRNPIHKVTLNSFYIAKYQVTQEFYESVTGRNPSEFKGDKRPVEKVQWYDAVEFCNSLSEKDGLEPCYKIDKENKDPNNENEYDDVKWTVECDFTKNGYRLPTEAEWEYAARGGQESNSYTYAGSNDLDSVGWHHYNSKKQTHDVGKKEPNELGLYDMSGNVSEWCWDFYGEIDTDDVDNPTGAYSSLARVLRGGSWFNGDSYTSCSVSCRQSSSARLCNSYYGFRLVRSSSN